MPVEQLSITITADPAGIWVIRRFVVSAARLLGADVDVGVVGLLTSELTANAIDLGAGGAEVTVRCIDDRLRVEVRDFGYGLPRVLHPGPTDDGGGRGLMIVDHLAHSWGVDQFLPGKIVWFEVGAAGSRAKSSPGPVTPGGPSLGALPVDGHTVDGHAVDGQTLGGQAADGQGR